jgi:hypothetical protein
VEHTIWIVFSPGVRHDAVDIVYSIAVGSVDAFMQMFGSLRAVDDRVTVYRYEDEDAAREDAAARITARDFARGTRCRDCGGVAHPATGCQYTPTWIVCGPCTRRAWEWIRQHVNGKGSRRGPRFYDHVNRIAPPLPVA